MPRRRPILKPVQLLRRRIRKLRGDDLTRLATAAGVARSTAYAIWSSTTRIPEPATLEALASALDVLDPLRRRVSAAILEVESTMTETLCATPDDAKVFGATVFEMCDIAAHVHSEYNSVVDLDCQASDAVFALGRGEPLEAVLGHIRDVDVRGKPAKHPAADEVRAALRELYVRFHRGGGAGMIA